jgi:glycerate dehydrogenase
MVTKKKIITVLDGHALNPGDLTWKPLEALGNCHIYERSTPAESVARARESEIVLTNKVPLGREQIAQLPKLQYIGVLATGYNMIDVSAARACGITVTNIPAYGTRSVAQYTLALLLELAHHVGHHAATVRARWPIGPDWCYWDRPQVELEGLTIGIVGYGRIGQAVATLAAAFGMKVLAAKTARTPESSPQVRFVELDDLFALSDVVSLHCPLTSGTNRLVNEARLARMKPGAFLLNTSRGPLVDETALTTALNQGRLAGAAVDVLSTEPPAPDNPLLTARNCLVTPHLAWATGAARGRLLATAVANLAAYLDGRPQNVVT